MQYPKPEDFSGKNAGVESAPEAFGPEEIRNRFGYHKPNESNQALHVQMRLKFMSFANFLDQVLPAGRAKNEAMTQLENTSMWTHKAIAEMAPVFDETIQRVGDMNLNPAGEDRFA